MPTPALRRWHVVEHEALSLFEEDSTGLAWCEKNATFSHREACEYLIFLPDNRRDRRTQLRTMRDEGASTDFLAVVRAAHTRNADFLLLFSG